MQQGVGVHKITDELKLLGLDHFFNKIYTEEIGEDKLQMVVFERNTATMSSLQTSI